MQISINFLRKINTNSYLPDNQQENFSVKIGSKGQKVSQLSILQRVVRRMSDNYQRRKEETFT